MSYTRGKCEQCGDNVFVPSIWMSIYPPVPSDFCTPCKAKQPQQRWHDMAGVPVPSVNLVGKAIEK